MQKQLGVTDIVSVKEELEKFVIVDQFIDRTFASCKNSKICSCINGKSYINGLMNACEDAIKKSNIEDQRNGNVVMEGPQFSTLAKNLYRSWKADVIGMTNMPEAKLKRGRN